MPDPSPPADTPAPSRHAAALRVAAAVTVDPSGVGGVARNLRIVTAGLRERGHDVELVWRAMSADDRERASLTRRLWRRLDRTSEEVRRIGRRIASLSADFAALAARQGPDVALTFDHWACIAVAESLPAELAGRTVLRAPSSGWCVDEWRENGSIARPGRDVERLRERERRAVHSMGRVVTLSRLASEGFDRLGVAAERVRVVPNGIDPGPWTPPARRAPGPLRVVWVGHLRPNKGLGDLATAVASLPAELHRRFEIDFVGRGNEPGNAAYESALPVLEASGVVHRFHGKQPPDRVREFVRRADVFVSASLREGMSNAILEAMAAGLCVVATDVGAAREMLLGESEGLIVPVSRPTALAAALTRALTDEDLRTVAGATNRGTVTERFSVERVVDAYEAVLLEAAGR